MGGHGRDRPSRSRAASRLELERLYGPRLERIILFGSRARGDARPDSDWDVAVVLRDYDGGLHEVFRLADLGYDLLLEAGEVLSLKPFTVEELGASHALHASPARRGNGGVNDEARSLLAKAHQTLQNARTILAAGVVRSAAREAYMTAFHAAQAYLADKQNRVPKTHAGVHGVFGQLAAADPALGREAARFLPRAYELKDIADYSTTKCVCQETAEMAIVGAAGFLDKVEAALQVRSADDQR